MLQRKLLAGVTTLGLVAGGSAVAVAAGSAPRHTTINAVTSFKVKVNRYLQIGTRWQKDVYDVKSGGTITIVNLAASDGPHSFSVVKKSDLPRTAKQFNNCKICQTIGVKHGVDPTSSAPPTSPFLENGTASATPPNIDRPGDSALIAATQKAKVTLKVTAKPGTTLYFMCIFHPQMQAKLIVQK